jgi:CoA:oxalate CoA-transferase
VRGPGPLSGLRVLSLGAFYAGNVVAGFLAGLGAEVVKIEPPTRAEVLRQRAYAFEPHVYTEPTGATTTPMFASLARGTLNFALDIKHPEGRELFDRLVPHAQIVIENFGAGILASWGFGFDHLKALNPLIVQLSLSGYGRTGPRSRYLAYARNISSFSGVTTLQDPQPQMSDAASAIDGRHRLTPRAATGAQRAMYPPSMYSSVPVTKLASSLAR